VKDVVMAVIRRIQRNITEDTGVIINSSGGFIQFLKDNSLYSYPLNLLEIIDKIKEHLNIEIKIEYTDNFDGYISGSLEKDVENWVIKVNNKLPKTRQYFTIAHELGHFFLHRITQNIFEDEIFFRGGIEKNTMEWEANNFAGEILMPKEEIEKQVKAGNNKIIGVAKELGVSEMDLRIRLKQLRMIK
jgi:Zn-dependent peptidase ImmA (M78 family)